MKKIAIIGAGISGLFIANLFKRNKKYQVNIFERNNSINSNEGYGIQLSVNSVKLLNKIGVSRGTCDLLCVYYDMLKFWNKKINLVSRKSIETSWERHFLDSAQLWLHLPYKAR